ncbi:MAG: DNA-processing protein DprA [Planctomycetota bacterium]
MNVDARTRRLLALTTVPKLGPVRIARLIAGLGDVESVLHASEAQLARVRGIGPGLSRTIARNLRDADRLADQELARLEACDAEPIAIGEDRYPALLAPLRDAPIILTARGTAATEHDLRAVAIVGSRRCSAYGIEQSERFAGVFARAGYIVVSGGARGIDAAAHRGALRQGGRTVAVLGCGLARCYPPEHRELFDRIAAEGGAVMSELPADTPPNADNFPARNRIISGMSLGVLVVEAGERSGALITARMAVEDHGREVFAIPGRIDAPASRGTNALLRDAGAALVTSPEEVVELLDDAAGVARRGLGSGHLSDEAASLFSAPERDAPESSTPHPGPSPQASTAPADPDHDEVLRALTGPTTLEALSVQTGLAPATLRARLTMLEIAGRVQRSGDLVLPRR